MVRASTHIPKGSPRLENFDGSLFGLGGLVSWLEALGLRL
jgi:hypothetical protein